MTGLLGIQREADRQALNRDAMNVRGGMLREDPSMLGRVGSSIADYAVPDRYGNAFSPSVMDPRLDIAQLESLRGTPPAQQDMQIGAEQVMNMMPGAGITAWHGSPHKFTKFDMSKIGTGEGAQAYGHGLYFAENPKVANEYAKTLSRPHPDDQYNEILKTSSQLGTGLDSREASYLESSMNHLDWDTDKIFDDFLDYAPEWKGTDDSSRQGIKKLINKIKGETSRGNEYKVDVPDDQIAKMLDWDKPVSGQQGINLPTLEEAMAMEKDIEALAEKSLASSVDSLATKAWEQAFRSKEYGAAKMVLNANNPKMHGKGASGEDYYDKLSYAMGREGASRHLKEQGIPGIKYLDGGSRTDGKGTSNFVLFDDQIPQILERNGKPLKGILGE